MAHILPGPEAPIYALTDSGLSRGRSAPECVAAMLSGGARIIQYREKEKKAGEMLRECREIRRLTREAGACFLINDHVDLALLTDADGVHLGQDDLPVAEARRLLGPEKIIGLSTHSPEQAAAARQAGADYIGVGPIFATKTKKDVCAPVTLAYLDWVVANCDLPFVAIGGIKRENIQTVARHGAASCALVSEIVSAPDIAERVRELRALMRAAR